MIKARINSYKDLVEERERLKVQAKNQLSAIEDGVDNLKDSFKPVQMALGAVGKLASVGASTAIANVVSESIFGKAARISSGSRLAQKASLPVLVKGFAFHLLSKYSLQIITAGIDMVAGAVKKKKEEKKMKEVFENNPELKPEEV